MLTDESALTEAIVTSVEDAVPEVKMYRLAEHAIKREYKEWEKLVKRLQPAKPSKPRSRRRQGRSLSQQDIDQGRF